jgi:4-hydroxy-3-polyprenylbenzoate decarboxylase
MNRLIIGISGASGAICGVRLLELLRPVEVETHLVLSPAAELTLAAETDYSVKQVKALADHVHAFRNIAAPISSGSFPTMGMIVAPCSIRTLAEVATGVTGNLLSRAADVVLKERRRLVLMVRETPLHTGHLRSMAAVSEMGAVVAPFSPAFYPRPDSLDDLVTQAAARLLDLFDIDVGVAKRWGEDLSLGDIADGED